VPKLHRDSAVLIYFSDSRLAAAALGPLSMALSARKLRRLGLCTKDAAISHMAQSVFAANGCDATVSIVTPDVTRNAIELDVVADYCVRNHYDTLIYAETLDRAMTVSVALLCQGRGTEAVNYCLGKTDQPIIMANILEDIKDKEISEYCKIMGCVVGDGVEPGDAQLDNALSAPAPENITRIISRFIDEIDEKNELALFNVKNTFKKLSK